MGIQGALLGAGAFAAASPFLFGPNVNEAFRASPVGQFSNQQLSPNVRGTRQAAAERQSRQFLAPPRTGKFGFANVGPQLSVNQTARVNEQIALRNKLNPFDEGVRRSDLSSSFFGEDIRRANVNKQGLKSLLGNFGS